MNKTPTNTMEKLKYKDFDAKKVKRRFDKLPKNLKEVNAATRSKMSDLNYQLLTSGEDEFRCLKAGFRFFGALLACALFYILLTYSFGFSLANAGYIIIVMALFFIFGFIFSKLIRCVILIMVPTLCTGRGRVIILSVITGIMIGGPVINIARNTTEISSSMACTGDLVKNQTKALLKQLVEPLKEMGRKLQHYMQELRLSIKGLNIALAPIRDAISKFNNTVQKSLEELAKIPKVKSSHNFIALDTVSQEPQCARFSRVFTCPPIV